jgi:two-component system chemotaxis sensor kinase CheA
MEYDELSDVLSSALSLKSLTIEEITDSPESSQESGARADESERAANTAAQNAPSAPVKAKAGGQHVISVNVSKLDELLKLMGELVISEAMVTQNPELEKLELDSFHKETRQLRKIIKDIQDTVMSMRMVPLATTFFKMHRIVRDMCKNLSKDIKLDVVGEETEVDKNIIEHISDPLMHIIRNSADHGVETPDERERLGKPRQGAILLEAKNSGSDVLISINDDGAGLNKDKILTKARNNGLLRKPESEYTDREIFQFIFMPGFSTNEKVTEFSGRGVGMDVVSKNIELVGGSVIVESVKGAGSAFTLKIPLTLAIIEGMMIKMGGAKYTLPIISIKDSFKPRKKDVFRDPNGNEMITVRGQCYNIVRLYEFFGVDSPIKELEDGIMIMVENGDNHTVCLFVDELVGEQQVVVKTMPKYIKRIRGISGCTLLGNGDISLIIDTAGFFD